MCKFCAQLNPPDLFFCLQLKFRINLEAHNPVRNQEGGIVIMMAGSLVDFFLQSISILSNY